ncbi:transmembrane protein 72 [Pogona vitticeps]
MSQITFWKALEYFCRLLGISTGSVLIGVGTDTLLQGQFKSLGTYLLISGVAVSVCEVAYFASLLLGACSNPKVGSKMHMCLKQVRCRGAFQKFLAYLLLSVACFLHPVLVWHVTIPGTMLVLTGLAYFLLSKQRKETRANRQEQRRDPYNTAVPVMGIEDPGQTYMFCKGAHGGRPSSFAGYLRTFFKGSKEQDAARNPASALSAGRQKHFEDNVVGIILPVREDLEEPESLAEESTSDTAPILVSQL